MSTWELLLMASLAYTGYQVVRAYEAQRARGEMILLRLAAVAQSKQCPTCAAAVSSDRGLCAACLRWAPAPSVAVRASAHADEPETDISEQDLTADWQQRFDDWQRDHKGGQPS